MKTRKLVPLAIGLATLLFAAPALAEEKKESVADIVAKQTVTIGGKEQIVSAKALEKARKEQKKSGKSGKRGKKTVYYMHNNPKEDISDPRYKGKPKTVQTDEAKAKEQPRLTREEKEALKAQEEQQRTAQEAMKAAPQTNATLKKPVLQIPSAQQARSSSAAAPYIGRKVTKVSVAGTAVTSVEAIQAVIETKPGMELTQEGLAQDLHAIYDLGWYYDLQPEFVEVPEGVQVVYRVLENPVYERLEVQGNTKISTSDIEKLLKMEDDQIINIKDVNTKVQRLEGEYNKLGYILARVVDIRMVPDGTLLLIVNEGIVEDFKVKGNVKTKDYVITREMKLEKGQPFNAKAARRSMQRIYNLGYFEDVNIRLNPGKAPNAVEIEISVVEMNTGTFGIGAGYSNADGFIGMVSIGDRNFRGTGDRVNLRWEFGGEDNKNYELSYTKPWIDDKETTASIVVYDATNEYADYNRDADEIARYDKKRRGQELTFSRKTDNEFVSNYVTLKNRDDIYEGMADGYENDMQYYEPFGTEGTNINQPDKYYDPRYDGAREDAQYRRDKNFGLTRSITVGRIYDSRDNIYDPHEGKRNSYSVEWAGGLGGDFDFTKFTVDYRYYYRGGGESVYAVQIGAGFATGDMPLSQRYSMGGSDTLRGYEDDQFRGNSMLKGTLEYRFPIVKKVQGVLFTDTGYAWDKDRESDFDLGLIKYSYGVGLRINSPLGPVKLDYGYGDDGGRFHFSFGGQF